MEVVSTSLKVVSTSLKVVSTSLKVVSTSLKVVSTSLKVVSTSLKVVSTLLNDNEVVKCVIVRGIISSVIKSTFILKIQTISHTMLVTYQLIL